MCRWCDDQLLLILLGGLYYLAWYVLARTYILTLFSFLAYRLRTISHEQRFYKIIFTSILDIDHYIIDDESRLPLLQ